jgi:thioredoxin 1
MLKRLAVVLILAGVALASGEKVKPMSVVTQNSTQYQVTFIELGSVKCVPCKMMQPIMDEVEKEYPKVQVVFHDVWTDAGRPYAEQYGIRGIPTQIFLDKQGKEYARHTGFFPKAELVKVLEAGLTQ